MHYIMKFRMQFSNCNLVTAALSHQKYLRISWREPI